MARSDPARHGDELAKLGATGGANAWFRATVHRLATEAGIELVEDAPAPKPRAKRAAK